MSTITDLKAKEACDIIMHQMNERSENPGTLSSFTVIDPNQFQCHRKTFPEVPDHDS
jgi:hypothetical protein